MKLWRGDSDSRDIRKLRTTIEVCEGLFTNLINSGNPFALTQQSFLASLHQHIVPGWNQSHFLSFSKSRQVAEGFAIGRSSKSLVQSNQHQWDTVIAELDFSLLTHVQTLAPGIDHYQFQEVTNNQTLVTLAPMHLIAKELAIKSRRQSGISSTRNIAVIDVVLHLQHLASAGAPVSPQALAFAQNDQEVLILPLDPLYEGGSGATALLDMGCISALEFFVLK